MRSMRPPAALVLVLTFVAALYALAGRPAAAAAPDGKALFLAQKCNLCHSVEPAGIARTSKSEKLKGPDLAGVAKRHDEAWIKRWLAKQEELNGKKHLGSFKGTPQEVDALVAWLAKQ